MKTFLKIGGQIVLMFGGVILASLLWIGSWKIMTAGRDPSQYGPAGVSDLPGSPGYHHNVYDTKGL